MILNSKNLVNKLGINTSDKYIEDMVHMIIYQKEQLRWIFNSIINLLKR